MPAARRRHTPQSPAPYWDGRFSNGPVWIEQLATDLQLSGNDFLDLAIGGSTTESSLTQQVVPFLAQNQNAVRPDATYVFWGGANDLLDLLTNPRDPGVVIGNALTNLASSTVALATAGGRHFLWVNMPDIGLTPRVLATNDPATIAGATALAAAFNQGMQRATAGLAGLGIQVGVLDAFALTRELAADPWQYRFFDVTTPALQPNGTVVHFPNRHLYFDDIHPTEAGHEEIMVAALRRLGVARRGDQNGDYRLDAHDVALLWQAFGPAPAGSPADLDGDSDVDLRDFQILRSLIRS